MATTTAKKTVRILCSLFSRYGLPRAIASDNGPQFISSIFKAFCKNNEICHKCSAPYHPSTKEEVECFTQSFKTGLRVATGDLQTTLCKFLMHYHSSLHASTGKTPAELMFNRNMQTRLNLIHPLPDKLNDQANISEMKTRQLKVDDLIWTRSYHTEQKWILGKYQRSNDLKTIK